MVMLRNAKAPERTGPQNVAFYIRVSSDKQAKKQDGSLDTQLDLLNRFVEYKKSTGVNWVVCERFIEGEQEGRRHGKSAKDTNRPTFQKMLAAAHARMIDVIVITKIDRISRSVVDFLLLVEDLDRHGVKIVSLHENIDLTTPAGKFQTILMIALAQHEREVIAARVKEKVAWRAEKGLPLGPPPIGYTMKNKTYVINPEYAEHVREADRIYLQTHSAGAVVVEFRKRGYRTPRGGCYNNPMICRMLRNPTYVGKIEYEGKIYDAQWESIRSRDTHEKIQKIMDRNARLNGTPNKPTREYAYLLQGLIRCGNCGHSMSPQPGTSRTGRLHPYYSCRIAEKSRGTACPFRYVPAQAADQAVLEFLKQLHLKPELVKEFAARANEFASETLARLRADLERVKEPLSVVRTKIANMVEAVALGGKTALASLKDKIEALELEKGELEATEARLKAEIQAEQTQEIAVQDQIQTLALFDRLVRENEDKPDRLKNLLPRFIDYVVWHSREKGEGEIEVALFPNVVALAPEVTYAGNEPVVERESVPGVPLVRLSPSDGVTDGI